jgi:hypothetical protein
MHTLEPYDLWRSLYIASEDENSPFYGREYNEFECVNTIYNYYIHPQWDDIGSPTLYIKILYVDYDRCFCVIELLGEWNDALHNDIMYLKRNIIEHLEYHHINKFILIGENILNYFSSDDSYYQEWFEDTEEGWIAALNFRKHVVEEFVNARIDYYVVFGETLNSINWRSYNPVHLFAKVESLMVKRLNTRTL